jgi:hypothetical protein
MAALHGREGILAIHEANASPSRGYLLEDRGDGAAGLSNEADLVVTRDLAAYSPAMIRPVYWVGRLVPQRGSCLI